MTARPTTSVEAARLRSVLDAFEDAAALLGPDGRIVGANRAWDAHGFREPVLSDGDPLPVIRAVEGDIDSFATIGRRLGNDGWRWFRSRVRSVGDLPGIAAILTHRDITDERRLNIRMARSPVAHLELEPDGSLLSVNERWEEMRGRPVGAELGLRWLRDTPADERRALLALLASGQPLETSLTTVGRDDRRCELAMDFEPVFDGGELIGWHASAIDRTELSELEEAASTALVDPLTGLANRSMFEATVDRVLARRDLQPAALLFLDLDGFKAVNDRGGHAAGDEVLRTVAERIRGALRPADLVARYGGDEFAVLLEEAQRDLAVEVADRLVDVFREPIEHVEGLADVGLSVGVTLSRVDDDVMSLVARADEAMYLAKAAGGMRVVVTRTPD